MVLSRRIGGFSGNCSERGYERNPDRLDIDAFELGHLAKSWVALEKVHSYENGENC
jgi:hypothetical protein